MFGHKPVEGLLAHLKTIVDITDTIKPNNISRASQAVETPCSLLKGHI